MVPGLATRIQFRAAVGPHGSMWLMLQPPGCHARRLGHTAALKWIDCHTWACMDCWCHASVGRFAAACRHSLLLAGIRAAQCGAVREGEEAMPAGEPELPDAGRVRLPERQPQREHPVRAQEHREAPAVPGEGPREDVWKRPRALRHHRAALRRRQKSHWHLRGCPDTQVCPGAPSPLPPHPSPASSGCCCTAVHELCCWSPQSAVRALRGWLRAQ